ncbi:hypothetical protein CcrSwift_gp036 [Caulobacter phage CcrSwift]|uniref:Uncharacterized protein n=1 Tax=Caulobacter phage CcrSwift TaxID=2927984 RepID=K4JSS2_9CAUD|nr:hypothetical protein D870_gp036 [Caulobacter phage CcrSwift]AFU88354.1 hypothetical protein CcrSwift_gp036 [Caulobacter phage CcrSwift]
MTEPRLSYCTVRIGVLPDGDIEYHLECRFEDGQKYAAVKVDGGHERLAHRIAEFLNLGAEVYDGQP